MQVVPSQMPQTIRLADDALILQERVQVAAQHTERLGNLGRGVALVAVLVQFLEFCTDDVLGLIQHLLVAGQQADLLDGRFQSAFLLQLFPPDDEDGTCLVVELRGDVECLGFREGIAGDFPYSAIGLFYGSGCQPKIRPTYLRPRFFRK